MMAAQIDTATRFIKERTGVVPDIALILGSGLGDLAVEIDGVAIPYGDIPGFPVSTAPQHNGVLHIGTLHGKPVVAMQGRVHMYEGYGAGEVGFPVHVMASLGATTLMVTNAAGGLNPAYGAGDIMAFEDHLSLPGLAGADPLRGSNDETLGPRFPSLNKAYDSALLSLAETSAEAAGVVLRRGTYAFAVGPSLETPAEVRALRLLGGDAVGMSSVPEVIVARHRGLRVLALSAICNMAVAAVDDDHVTSAEEVYAAIETIRPRLNALIVNIFDQL